MFKYITHTSVFILIFIWSFRKKGARSGMFVLGHAAGGMLRAGMLRGGMLRGMLRGNTAGPEAETNAPNMCAISRNHSLAARRRNESGTRWHH